MIYKQENRCGTRKQGNKLNTEHSHHTEVTRQKEESDTQSRNEANNVVVYGALSVV
jgi:hypothetical protein